MGVAIRSNPTTTAFSKGLHDGRLKICVAVNKEKSKCYWFDKSLDYCWIFSPTCGMLFCTTEKEGESMQRKLLTNGSTFKRTDNRWGGVVWYQDEKGERKRKSFSGTTKQEVNQKLTDYIAAFTQKTLDSNESRKTLRESMQNGWKCSNSLPSNELPMTVANAPPGIRSIPRSETKSSPTSPPQTSKPCSIRK